MENNHVGWNARYSRCLVLMGALMLSIPAWSDTRTWDGGAVGDSDWTSNLNWDGTMGVNSTDSLVFPESASRKTNNNDLGVNFLINGITFSGNGYVITGDQILLVNGVHVGALTTPNSPQFGPNILLFQGETFDSDNVNTTLFTGVIGLDGNALSLDGDGVQRFNNIFTGVGNINKGGNGVAIIQNTGPTSGTCQVNAGTLEANGTLGLVHLNGGTLAGEGTVSNIIVFAGGGAVSPGHRGTDAGTLDVNGSVDLGHTNVSYNVNLNGGAISQYDRLIVDGDDVNLSNGVVAVTLGFTPTNGQRFHIIVQTGNGAIAGQFSQGTNIVVDGQIFSITYSATNVALTSLGSTITWTGGGANSNWSTVANWIPSVAPTSGLSLVFPDSAARKTNFNNIANDSSFGSLTFNGNGYVINGNQFFLEERLSNNLAAGSPVQFNADIILATAETFTAVSAVPCILDHVNLNGHPLVLNGAGVHRIDGLLNGSASLSKFGTGTAIVSGVNLLFGNTTINAGVFEFNGNISGVDVNGGTLSGTGSVNDINCLVQGGILSPGQIDTTNAGTWFVNGLMNLSSNTTLKLNLNGPTAGSQYDRIILTPTNKNALLDGAILDISLGFAPTNGQKFTIIQQGTTIPPLAGQFAQGPLLTAGGQLFGISYSASNVILTALATKPVPAITGASFTPGATGIIFAGTNGNPASTYFVVAATNLFIPTTNWQVIATNVFDGAGNFILTNPVNPALPLRFLTIRSP